MKLFPPQRIRLEASSITKAIKDKAELMKITASAHDLDILKKEDLKDNTNFLYLHADLCNAGIRNKNGDCMLIEDAVKIYKKFEHTFVNTEHSNDIRGFILKANLTDIESKKNLTEQEALALNKPFNISIGFLIWTNVDDSFTSLIKKIADSDGEPNELLSLSLELSFNDFFIYRGESSNIFEGEIIKSDEDIEKLYKNLRAFGGDNKDSDGNSLGLIATGDDLMPGGCGIVVCPAGFVSGISSKIKAKEDKNDNDDLNDDDLNDDDLNNNDSHDEDEHNEDCCCEKCKEQKEANNNLNIKGSQLNNINVKTFSMKINNISDITEENLKEIKACEVVTFLSDELGKLSEEHAKAMEAKASELESLAKEKELASAEVATISANLEKVQNELNEIKASQEAQAKEASFNDRMSALDEEFELSDKDREIIASDIRDLSDEEYGVWKKKFDVFASAKNKEVIKSAEDKEKKKEIKASDKTNEENLDNPLENLKAKVTSIPSSVEFSKDIVEQYKDAFSLGKGFTVEI